MGALIDVKGDHVEIAPMSSSILWKCLLKQTFGWHLIMAHTGRVSIFAEVTWLSPEVRMSDEHPEDLLSFSLILNFYIKIAIPISKMGTHETVV